jgi:hypothetical protein
MDFWPVKDREKQYLHISKAGKSPPSFGRDLQTRAAQAVSQNMSPISTPGVLLVSLAVVTPLRLAVTSYALKKAPGSYTGSAD